MSRTAKIQLDWAGARHTFRLAIGQLVELQEACGAGPRVIVERLSSGAWLVQDVREPLRLGLIGGGMKPKKAERKVERYVDEQPLNDNVAAALAVTLASVIGVEDEAPGDVPEAARRPAMTASAFAPIYGFGAVMGFTPRDIDRMMLWEF